MGDLISRQSLKQKLQEHHDFFINAYGGFSNLPQNDKSRVDEITNCIAMVVNEPSVTIPSVENEGDLISRERLINEWNDLGRRYAMPTSPIHKIAIREFPSADVRENKGEWIDDVKSEIDKAQEPYITSTAYDEGVRFGLMLAYQIVDRCKESEDKE